MSMEKIEVHASAQYTVFLEPGLLSRCGEIISQQKPRCGAVIVSDDIVFPLYGNIVKKSLEQYGYTVTEFIFAHGESSKNLQTVTALLEFLAQNKISRADMLVALGGGVVGDLTGFAASIYLRGIPYVQIPTTFLAAIDSSVGGKTGVDFSGGKNLIGSFYQPAVVLCDTDTFQTLPEEIFKDGLCEAIKYGCILDKDLFTLIADGNPKENILRIVSRCVTLKRNIVEEDEFDTGRRQILNFGHTAGHAMEALSNYRISHGRAVAMGMYLLQNAVCEKTAREIHKVLGKYGIGVDIPFSAREIAQKALSDKKVKGDSIMLVILSGIGNAELKKVKTADLEAFFEAGMNRR